ncbi:MAG: hypothetical protein JOY52_12325 [Hyphomicrobiales bacterium]|nr:hypothetical protein [Hyphomicrobiales bacterium]
MGKRREAHEALKATVEALQERVEALEKRERQFTKVIEGLLEDRDRGRAEAGVDANTVVSLPQRRQATQRSPKR